MMWEWVYISTIFNITSDKVAFKWNKYIKNSVNKYINTIFNLFLLILIFLLKFYVI